MGRLGMSIGAALAAVTLMAAAPAVSADEAPSAHKLEMARQLFAGMNMPQLMDSVTKSMGTNMLANLRKANPKLTDEQATAISEAVAESTRDLMPKVMDRMIPVYASTFSEKELTDALAFYNSPSGKAMLAKMPAMMAQMGPIMQELTPQMMADVQKRVCAKTDCSKLGPPKS